MCSCIFVFVSGLSQWRSSRKEKVMWVVVFDAVDEGFFDGECRWSKEVTPAKGIPGINGEA